MKWLIKQRSNMQQIRCKAPVPPSAVIAGTHQSCSHTCGPLEASNRSNLQAILSQQDAAEKCKKKTF
jgi:hypothetical protein